MLGWHLTQMRGRSIDLHRGRPSRCDALGFLPLSPSFPTSIRGECRHGRPESQTYAETEENGAERSAENDAGYEKGAGGENDAGYEKSAGYGDDAESVPTDARRRFEAFEGSSDARCEFHGRILRRGVGRRRLGYDAYGEKGRRGCFGNVGKVADAAIRVWVRGKLEAKAAF